MATTTTNVGLTKPSANELYDVSVQNNNMDVLDKLIESGENTNGGYVKFLDGTLICYPKERGKSCPVGNTADTWTYPYPFISKPALSLSVGDSSGRPELVAIDYHQRNHTSTSVSVILRNMYTGVLTIYWSGIAIGRWK